ncbi:MAG: glycosyltransferase family 2 protein [Dehalococcoidia bacterium]|nr:MAG: glycosyltransferase family 2 protein [Dehalococcoidia bacterium]
MPTNITPIILTLNEELNIERTLSQLNWAQRIIIIDSYSTDKTISILKKYVQVELFQRKFDSFDKQSNFALQQVKTEWVLSLDADYVVSDGLIEEIRLISDRAEDNGFWVPLRFCVDGVPLKCSVLPPRIVLFRKSKAVYYQDGHAHRLNIDGKTGHLRNFIYHDDRKPFKIWFKSQEKYSAQEADKLDNADYNKLKWVDKLRKLAILVPLLMPVYILLFKRGVFEGKRAVYYAYLRAYYEAMLSLKLLKLYFGIKTTERLKP